MLVVIKQYNVVIPGRITIDDKFDKDYYNYFDGITGQNQFMVILFPLNKIADTGYNLKKNLVDNSFFKHYDNSEVPEADSKKDVLEKISEQINSGLPNTSKSTVSDLLFKDGVYSYASLVTFCLAFFLTFINAINYFDLLLLQPHLMQQQSSLILHH